MEMMTIWRCLQRSDGTDDVADPVMVPKDSYDAYREFVLKVYAEGGYLCVRAGEDNPFRKKSGEVIISDDPKVQEAIRLIYGVK